MTKFTAISALTFVLFHPTVFAIEETDRWSQPQTNNQYSTSTGGGLDFASVTASAFSGYIGEKTNSDYWPNAAVAIAVSAGLHYSFDSQFDSVSDVKVTPYFNGSETGVAVSFTFQ